MNIKLDEPKRRPPARTQKSQRSDPGSQAAFEALKSLQLELRRLRSLAKEIAAAYVSKLEARAQQMADRLGEASAVDAGVIGVILKKIRNLNVKPHKGRRKDLRKLEDLLEGLDDDVDEVVDGGAQAGRAAPESREKKRRTKRA